MKNSNKENVMLLGHDPVAYFTQGQPIRGNPRIKTKFDGVVFYFVNEKSKKLFQANPEKYFPQYGAFCSSGAAFAIKLGSDPTEFVIRNGRIFFFGDVLGRVAWEIDPEFNIYHGDKVWPNIKNTGWRWQSLKSYINRVDWYKNTKDISNDFAKKHPGKKMPNYNPGGMMTNLFFKSPGWRAREGFGQPVVGFVGEDPCPPACPGRMSISYSEKNSIKPAQ